MVQEQKGLVGQRRVERVGLHEECGSWCGVCVWGGGAEEHTSQLLSEKWAVTVMAGWEDGVVAPMSENSFLSFSNPSLQLVLLNGRTQCYPLPVEMPSSRHLQV